MKTRVRLIAPEIVVTVACLVLVRGLLAVAGPEWRGRGEILNAAEYLRTKRADDRGVNGTDLSVLALGSSRMNSAFRSDLWAEHSGLKPQQVANLAFPGGTLWEAVFLLRRSGGLPPSVRLVIVELSHWSFNRNSRGPIASNPSLAGRSYLRQWMTLADRWHIDDRATRLSYLGDWLWPMYLRQPLSSWTRLAHNPPHPQPIVPHEPMHWHPTYEKRLANDPKFKARRIAEGHFYDPEVSAFEVRNLDLLLNELGASGADVVLVQLPIRKAYLEVVRAAPRKMKLYDEVHQIAEKRIKGMGRLLLLETAEAADLDESIFTDYGHFNKIGAGRLTDVLYDRIANEN